MLGIWLTVHAFVGMPVGLHVLVHLVRVRRAFRLRIPGLAIRLGLAGATLAAGFAVATLTLPAADQLQDRLSARVGFDGS